MDGWHLFRFLFPQVSLVELANRQYSNTGWPIVCTAVDFSVQGQHLVVIYGPGILAEVSTTMIVPI